MATSIAQIMREQGAAAGDFEETVREIEQVKAVRFAFHPWMPLNNLGADTFRFNLPYATLPRLEPIPVTVVPRVRIEGKQPGHFGVMNVANFVGQGRTLEGDSSGFGGMVALGSGANVKQERQLPGETIKDLTTAWGHVGMVALQSLDAADERELEEAYVVFEAVMGVAHDGAEVGLGRRAAQMTLEDFPLWLDGRNHKGEKIPGVNDAVSHAISKGVTRMVKVVQAGAVVGAKPRHYDFPRGGEAKAKQLIEEIQAAVERATDTAINPANGVLTKTRRAVQIARNGGGPESKNHYDALDLFLMREFPSFDMDTDVERAQRTLQGTVEKSAEGSGDTAAALLALTRQNAQVIEMLAKGQEQTQKLLGALVTDKQPKQPAARK